ncbi:MAG: SMI1/KNR4 family protein [Lentisphaeraceae bacterium]|nr:SMI1/KNR4 family protein [Lentisphaeraceae bacterium]
MRFFILLTLIILTSCNDDKGSFASEASFEGVWQRYKVEVENKVGKLDFKFNEPATLASLDQLKKETSLELPDEVLELYKMGNGQAEDGFALFRGMTLLSISEVIKNWQQMKTVKHKEMTLHKEGRVKADYWNEKWLPIAADAGNNYICVDFDPVLGGSKGQLIRVYTDANIREFIAKTPKSYFAAQAAGLKNGQLKFDDFGVGPFTLEELKAQSE